MTYKSTVTKNKELKYDEIIRIGKLQAPKPFVDQETQRITKMHQHDLQSGKMNNGQVQQMVQNSIIQRNIIEATKEYLKSFVTVTFNDEDINAAIAELKIKQPQIPETAHKQIAERVVYENLIFAFLVKEWNIVVTDSDVDKALDEMYRVTNQSIREYKTDKNKYEDFRNNVKIQRILEGINHHFKITAEIDLTQGLQPENKN